MPKKTGAMYFIRSVAPVLIITGFAKIWSSFGNAHILIVADPVIGLQFGHLMLAVGLLELGVAGICLFGKSQKLILVFIAYLASNFALYRTALWWMGWKKHCNCLGNLTDALHIPPQTADTAMKIILAYLLIGSYASLFWLWRQKRRLGTGSSEIGVGT